MFRRAPPRVQCRAVIRGGARHASGEALMRFSNLSLALAGAAGVCLAGAASPAAASSYEFLAAPQINLSLVYRLDKLTGEVIACQFGHNPGKTDVEPGAFGVTVCYRSGEGAGKQDPGDYGLIATRHEQEGGVFRVDYRSGSLSICYIYFQKEKQGDREVITDQYVVCSAPSK